ncbi:MAG: AmmeMemoRadiSam system protein A [bacterium]
MLKKFYSHYLSKAEQKTLLKFARESIAANLRGEDPAAFENQSPRLSEERGAFVTLLKNNSLRGCIGFVQSYKPLYETIKEVAVAAAFRDPRFPPLSENELPEIIIEISVISPMQKIQSIKKIKIKRHGLFISHGKSQGLLLPQVAVNNKWDRQTFLEHVCLKAGLKKNDWKNPEAEIMIFQAQVFKEDSKR